METEGSQPCSQKPDPGRFETFPDNKNFYGEGLLAPCPTPKLEDHPLSD